MSLKQPRTWILVADSAIEPHVDPVRQAEHRFSDAVAEALEARLVLKEFDHFVLVAGPTMLGEIRAVPSADRRAVVHATLDKAATTCRCCSIPKPWQLSTPPPVVGVGDGSNSWTAAAPT